MYIVLDWDSSLFGFKTARLDAYGDFQRVVDELENANKSDIQLLYVCVNPDSERIVNYLNQKSYTILDHRITYRRHIDNSHPISFDSIIEINENNYSNYQKSIYNLALLSGQYSRFKLDEKIPDKKFEELYFKWIDNTIADSARKKIFVYKNKECCVGLVTVLLGSIGAKIGLIAVDESFQRNSIGHSLMRTAEKYARDNGKQYLDVVTQKINTSACNFYEKLKYKVDNEQNVYHLWLK